MRDISIVLLHTRPMYSVYKHGVAGLIRLKNDKYLLQHQIEILKYKFRNYNYEIIVVLGDQYDKMYSILPKNTGAVLNEQHADTNETKDIFLGLMAASAKQVIIINGNLLFDKNAFNFKLHKSGLIINELVNTHKQSLGCTVTGSKIEHVFYGLPHQWSNITFLRDKEIKQCYDLVSKESKQRYYFFEILNEMIDKGGNLSMLRSKSKSFLPRTFQEFKMMLK